MGVGVTLPHRERIALRMPPRVWLVAGLIAVLVILMSLVVRPVTETTRSPAQLASEMYSQGFYDSETDAQGNRFVWTQGNAATRFDLTSEKPLQIILALRSAAVAGGPDAPIHILVNGQDVQTVRPDPQRLDFQTFTVRIPRSDAAQLTVGITGPIFQPAKDRRMFGTMVQRITVDTQEAWSGITKRWWLYGLALVCGVLAVALLTRTANIARFVAIGCCAVAVICMIVALLLLTRIGEVDRSGYYLRWLGTAYLAVFFGIAALAIPFGEPDSLSLYQRITQSAIAREHRVAVRWLRDGGLVLLAYLLSLHFFTDTGAGDVQDKLKWMRTLRQLGVIAGYRANENVYPPFTQVILAVFERMARLAGWSDYFAFKLSIAVFLAITVAMLLLWTRNAVLIAVIELGLIVNTMALGYTDIYFAPTLLIALWALRTRRVLLFTVAFAVTCLIKWQAAVLAPILLLYLLHMVWTQQHGWSGVKTLGARLIVPSCIIGAGVLAIFGGETLTTLHRAMNERYLSANAVNFNWIVTYCLHIFRSGYYGGIDGISGNVKLNKEVIIGVPGRVLFVLFFGYAIYRFLRGPKTYENALFWSLCAYVAYFLFNMSVHENHLFPAVMLAAVLCFVRPQYWWLLAITLVELNINLLLFYGLNGVEMVPPPIIGTIDLALVVSVANVALFLWLLLWRASVDRQSRELAATGMMSPATERLNRHTGMEESAT